MDWPSPARAVPVVYALETLASCGTTDLVGHLVAGLDRRRFAPEIVTLRPAPSPLSRLSDLAGGDRGRP